MHAIQAILVVQVRGGCETGTADIADGLALTDTLSNSGISCEARHVCVQRRNVAAVLQYYRIAIATLAAAKNHLAIASRFDRRTLGCCVIHTLVGANSVQHRVFAARVKA